MRLKGLKVAQATLRSRLRTLLIQRSGIRRGRDIERAKELDRLIHETQQSVKANAAAIRAAFQR